MVEPDRLNDLVFFMISFKTDFNKILLLKSHSIQVSAYFKDKNFQVMVGKS